MDERQARQDDQKLIIDPPERSAALLATQAVRSAERREWGDATMFLEMAEANCTTFIERWVGTDAPDWTADEANAMAMTIQARAAVSEAMRLWVREELR